MQAEGNEGYDACATRSSYLEPRLGICAARIYRDKKPQPRRFEWLGTHTEQSTCEIPTAIHDASP